MKSLVVTLLTLFTAAAWAYPCPSGTTEPGDAQLLHEWLTRFQGHVEMKGCQLEITACDPQASGGDALIGEIFIVDQDRREAYLPLTMVASDNPKIKTSLRASQKRMRYLKVDHFYEEEFGRTETYRLELRLGADGQSISRLDLGTYATNKRLRQPNGNQSRWYNCGESAERP